MSIIAWIVIGALAGWIASMIMGTNRQQGCLIDIVVGVVGAFLGGFLFELFTGRGFNFGFNIGSLIIAILGAVVLLAILGFFRRR